MSCPGIHCPGCSGGQSLGIVAGAGVVLGVAYATVAVVREYIIPIAVTAVLCFALAVAASVWLERWSDRRAAAWGAARDIVSRADMILPPPVRAAADLPLRQPPALLPPQVVVNIFGQPSAEQAAVIRQAVAPALDSPYPRQPAG